MGNDVLITAALDTHELRRLELELMRQGIDYGIQMDADGGPRLIVAADALPALERIRRRQLLQRRRQYWTRRVMRLFAIFRGGAQWTR